MSDDRHFLPWRALKSRVFWPILVVWNLLCLLAAFLDRENGGRLLTPASNVVAVSTLALALILVLLLLLSGRVQAAAFREGEYIDSYRTQLWGLAATFAFLVIAFSVKACSVL